MGLLLLLLPGGVWAVEQKMPINALASSSGNTTSSGGITGSRQPQGVTHCPQLVQTLLRLFAAMYSWRSCDPQEPPVIDCSVTRCLVEYLHGLLLVGPSAALVVADSPCEVCLTCLHIVIVCPWCLRLVNVGVHKSARL